MKRRDFMKLSAATALGATVAAMAPSALAATELDQTNGDLHTTVDRKTAAWVWAMARPLLMTRRTRT